MSRLARLFAFIVFVLAAVAPVLAQTDELQLLVRRNIGYRAGSQIQGSFRMQATGPADLASVTFKIDERVVATVTAAPFQVDFNTDSYALGSHTLVAEGQTASGRKLASAPSVFEFVSAAVGWQTAGRLALPILGVLGVLVVIAVGASLLDMRRSRRSPVPLGASWRYGLPGGAICPKCGRPFSRHWWALNAGVGKLDRCPQCGRWGVVRALPLEQLRAAEAAELDQAKAVTPELSAEEKLRRQLDESRFDKT